MSVCQQLPYTVRIFGYWILSTAHWPAQQGSAPWVLGAQAALGISMPLPAGWIQISRGVRGAGGYRSHQRHSVVLQAGDADTNDDSHAHQTTLMTPEPPNRNRASTMPHSRFNRSEYTAELQPTPKGRMGQCLAPSLVEFHAIPPSKGARQ